MSPIRFLKNWTLPIAMLCGALGYFILAYVPAFEPFKPIALETVHFMTPILIFLMLFFTFCKVRVSELRPTRWHLWLLSLQTLGCIAVASWLIVERPSYTITVIGEGLMACIICPTAMAAAVITGKLGGNAGSLTSYTLSSNLLSAVLITVLCPLVHINPHLNIWSAFFIILYKVVNLLILPFFAAWIVRVAFPRFHAFCLGLKDVSFYIWGVSLTMVMGQAIRILMINLDHWYASCSLIITAFIICALLFLLGKAIGGHYHERISGGQALGQKNTVFGIWMAINYLTPISAVAVGAYIVAQNTVNSWQLWRKRHQDEMASTQNELYTK